MWDEILSFLLISLSITFIICYSSKLARIILFNSHISALRRSPVAFYLYLLPLLDILLIILPKHYTRQIAKHETNPLGLPTYSKIHLSL